MATVAVRIDAPIRQMVGPSTVSSESGLQTFEPEQVFAALHERFHKRTHRWALSRPAADERDFPWERFDAVAFTSQMWFLVFLYGWGATLAAVVYAYVQSMEVTKKTGVYETYSREEALALENMELMSVTFEVSKEVSGWLKAVAS